MAYGMGTSRPGRAGSLQVVAMKKADIVNIIKDAEEQAEKLRDSALEQKENNIAKARIVAQQKIDQGATTALAKYNEIIQKALDELKQEKPIQSSKVQKVQEDFRVKALSNVEESSEYILSEFERATNV